MFNKGLCVLANVDSQVIANIVSRAILNTGSEKITVPGSLPDLKAGYEIQEAGLLR